MRSIPDYRLADGQVGTEAIHLIRKSTGTPVPGIIVTGDTSPDRIKETKASGFRILHKPVDVDVLMSALDELLGKAS